MARVVITGVGCVTPIGIGLDAFSDSLRRGVSGVGPLSLCDPTPHECRVAAEVRNFDALEFMDLREARTLPRVAQFAVAAARLALRDARLELQAIRDRVGIVVGTSSGPIAYSLEQHAIYFERGMRRVHPSTPAYGHNGVIASECAIQLGIHGPVLTLSSACTSAADAIGLGRTMIQAGMVDVLLVGGADAPICPSVFAGFERLGMMPTQYNSRPEAAARPFDVDREGLVLGEGAVIFVMEGEHHARRRDARLVGEVAGYGATCDAWSHFKQEESGTDAARAIEQALACCGISSADIDYINAHGTGTRENDPFEARVLRRVFGERISQVPVSSSKSQFGHLLGAAGAVEAAAVLVAINEGFAPPTLNLEHPDPECELAHVACKPLTCSIDTALSTSFGFGSRNAALVFRRSEG